MCIYVHCMTYIIAPNRVYNEKDFSPIRYKYPLPIWLKCLSLTAE